MKLPIFTIFTLISSALAIPTATSPIKARTTPATMAVRNFTRDCSNPDICTYKFLIDYSPYGEQTCTIVNNTTGKDGKAAVDAEWFGVGCVENPTTWEISWGWNYNDDFTVMTIVDEPNQYEAFFGYSHPNTGGPVFKYADVGPNTVQAV